MSLDLRLKQEWELILLESFYCAVVGTLSDNDNNNNKESLWDIHPLTTYTTFSKKRQLQLWKVLSMLVL